MGVFDMANYVNRYVLSLSVICITAGLSFAAEPSNTTKAKESTSMIQETSGKLTTPRGNIYVGMDAGKLYDVFQSKDLILTPEAVLNKECHVFRDWTSNNPNDTITFFVNSGKVTGWYKGYVAACQNKGSKYEYEYGNKTPISVWFFPKNKAKWDGAEVNLLDWNKLTQAQKIMFITEYIKQLNLQYNTSVDIDVDKYIIGMNYYSSNCPKECENISASGAINNLLVSDGKATKKIP